MTPTRRSLAVAVLACIAAAPLFAAPAAPARAGLTTVAERSGFVRTGRYEEVIALCDAFAKAYPEAVRCIDFGTTPEHRPMKALVVSRTGALTAEAARAGKLPVVLMQGGIHAGEIDGKDAGFLALRELLDDQQDPGVLDKQVFVFVPVFNVDGHERFAAWNRPNQRGPEEWAGARPRRTTTSTAITRRPTRRKCRRCCASSRPGTRSPRSTCT